jgi:hypothetical protein
MEREHSSPQVQRQTSKSRLGRSLSYRRLSSPSEIFQRLSGSPSKNSFYAEEAVPTALDGALQLLNLRDVAGLEDNFLNTDAFLRPWAFFRDNFLLVQPKGKPRASAPGRMGRLDILWWYTYYEEGRMRYDPLADEDSWEYEEDTSKHGVIDRSRWGVEEYEKYLYAWLLQTFKVGKTVNPYGFEYFEERNICTAWVEVFLPVLDAVRKDYDHPSRFRYGRLAKFIEEACPSHFTLLPESNTRQGLQPTVTPAIALGISLKNITPHVRHTPSPRKADPVTGFLWGKKVYDDDEKELKRTYPLYGHLGELPKFKTVMKDWLRQQKEAISRKRALRHLEGASSTPRSSLHGQTFRYDYGQSSPYETMKTEMVRKDSDPSDYSKMSSVKPSPRRRPSVKRESSDGVYTAIRSSNPFTEHELEVLGTSP